MNNKDEMAPAMITLSYRHTLGQLLGRHMMPGLMPPDSASQSLQPGQPTIGQLSPSVVARLLRQAQRHDRLHITRPQATFNAPQPAVHLAATYHHPVHIPRADIDGLPETCGVYIFRGANDMALYVGRSLNLRSRVLAHLYDHDDQLLVRQTRRIEYRRSAGELGAALMEASLLRQLRPAHNKKPRPHRALHTLMLDASGRVNVAKVDPRAMGRTDQLFGIFASQPAALEALQKLVAQHELCGITCGLEPAAELGVACFGRQIRRCRGACTGEESPMQHHARLAHALEELRVRPWPYQGPMAIVERAEDGWTQLHVMDQWRYLGSLDDQHHQLPAPVPMPMPACAGFDVDSYKLVIQPYLLGLLELRALPG